ncbi:MAG: hypothetical protein KC503_10355 [Myxococcales bacterium]|nr:hypothetical protein [Myxococcales bacterium]
MRRKLPIVAAKVRVPVAGLTSRWEAYRQSLPVSYRAATWSAADATRWCVRDPKDIPYVAVCEHVGADGIITADSDFRHAPVAVVHPEEFNIPLRDYARARTREFTLSNLGLVNTYLATRLGHGTVAAAASAVRRIPRAAWLPLALLAAAALTHPTLGSAIRRCFARALDALRGAAEFVIPIVADGVDVHRELRQAGDEIEAHLLNMLTQGR